MDCLTVRRVFREKGGAFGGRDLRGEELHAGAEAADDAGDVLGVVEATVRGTLEGEAEEAEGGVDAWGFAFVHGGGEGVFEVEMIRAERIRDVVVGAVLKELGFVVFAPRAEDRIGKGHHPGGEGGERFGESRGGSEVRLSDRRELGAERGEDWVADGMDERLEGGLDFESASVLDESTDFNDFHLVARHYGGVGAGGFEVDDEVEGLRDEHGEYDEGRRGLGQG